jgi:glycosyltransferase involved in cell wall biosynthesis
LTALEAGLAGCNIVITNRSYISEYLKDFALYVDPASVEDIKEKILEAYEKPKTDELKQHILNNYTWEQTAKRTMKAYDVALNRH